MSYQLNVNYIEYPLVFSSLEANVPLEPVSDLTTNIIARDKETSEFQSSASSSTLSSEANPLLSLPTELRQEIYGWIFHDQHGSNVPCNIFNLQRGNIGCRCGDGLSRTNRQLYNETRPHFYNCARFVFMTPIACKKFLESIGSRADWMGSLKVSYTDNYFEPFLFRNIFRSFGPDSNLRYLSLQVAPRKRSLLEDHPLPMYLPSSQIAFPAEFYDLSLRPGKHPLVELNSIRSLTVVGHPEIGEMEEAILHLSLKMEKKAREEGKYAKKVEELHVGFREWFYSIEIIDEEGQ